MPCVGCEKECKCTSEKCDESCKCSSPGKCGCNAGNVAQSTAGGCCQKAKNASDKTEKSCCHQQNTKKE